MKINDISNKIAIENYAKTVKRAVLPSVSQPCDKLELNDTARIFSEAVKAAKEASDVSEKLVRTVSDKIRNGTYNVSGSEVADKILDRRQKGV